MQRKGQDPAIDIMNLTDEADTNEIIKKAIEGEKEGCRGPKHRKHDEKKALLSNLARGTWTNNAPSAFIN